ncbi:hypothetical protein [Swingsia samuiensis]|uniref:Uncharacterized protein n=1 Tax=Swingsia samuiensis TaxID=1293412 RepID=A0A4Y6UML1_9PROT|nr:hypothetical protein [Swingsia samuiensis]QDH17265.1 hypothetical protein E3D00_06600 [Swingsia samuiensis]
MRKLSLLFLMSAPIALASLSGTSAFAAHHAHGTANLPQLPPTTAHNLNQPDTKTLTPAQQVALPDGGAPPPPHGYVAVDDSEVRIANFSNAARTHLPVGLPPTNPQQSVGQPNNLPSHFSLFGMPVKFNAPVAPPYRTEDASSSFDGRNGQNNILPQADSSLIH